MSINSVFSRNQWFGQTARTNAFQLRTSTSQATQARTNAIALARSSGTVSWNPGQPTKVTNSDPVSSGFTKVTNNDPVSPGFVKVTNNDPVTPTLPKVPDTGFARVTNNDPVPSSGAGAGVPTCPVCLAYGPKSSLDLSA
jgi:hypothetical protein